MSVIEDGVDNVAFPAEQDLLATALGSNGLLEIAQKRPSTDSATVLIESHGCYCTAGQLMYSLPHPESPHAAIGIFPAERRKALRIKVTDTARLISLQWQLSVVDCPAQVSDVSWYGVGLITAIPIACGMLVKIVLDRAIVFGEVRHCTRLTESGSSFRVGVEIELVIFRPPADLGGAECRFPKGMP